MVEPKYDPKTGVWVCPVCGWTAMSKKVIKNHIKREHPEAVSTHPSQDKQTSTKKVEVNDDKKPKRGASQNGKKKQVARFKVGDTTIEVEKRPKVEIRDQSGWRFFLTANYVASLHKKRVRVKLITGEEFEGRLKARDPYFIGLILDGSRKVYLNKAHIVLIEPLEG